MTVKELQELSNEELIEKIYSYGVSIHKGIRKTKKDEKYLQNIFKVLELRGIIKSWKDTYNSTKNSLLL